MRTLSDLFDLSIHFISFFIALIFLLPYSFLFLDVVDYNHAHRRWGAGSPGLSELLHRLWAQRPLHHRGFCWIHPGVFQRAAVPWTGRPVVCSVAQETQRQNWTPRVRFFSLSLWSSGVLTLVVFLRMRYDLEDRQSVRRKAPSSTKALQPKCGGMRTSAMRWPPRLSRRFVKWTLDRYLRVLATIAYYLFCGPLRSVYFLHLIWDHSCEVLLGFLDVMLDVLVSVTLHVSSICIPPLAFGGCISLCVIASFPPLWPGTAFFTLLPFDATGKSSPRWRLALAQEAVRGIVSLRLSLLVFLWHSRLCVLGSQCLDPTLFLRADVEHYRIQTVTWNFPWKDTASQDP